MANVSSFNILCWKNFGWAPQEAKMQMVTSEVLGPNPRLLFQLYALEQSSYYQKVLEEKDSRFEDIVDAYLAFLQVTVVNPAMDKALEFLQKLASDARNGKIPKNRLCYGSPWRHPSKRDDPTLCQQRTKLQLLDFVQSLVNIEFGIVDDPCTVALLERIIRGRSYRHLMSRKGHQNELSLKSTVLLCLFKFCAATDIQKPECSRRLAQFHILYGILNQMTDFEFLVLRKYLFTTVAANLSFLEASCYLNYTTYLGGGHPLHHSYGGCWLQSWPSGFQERHSINK
ncbi:hypothetical protein NC651_032638 [Populus alba x Populus x berolinensis]|nr:hypothetical protein NC651_032638 [Populus alba x Populus x berolinensis]